ncbi:hypothetical protein QYF36_009197 [Acer negundo]|nr:hypothetical protein QYF36_009197 [Acer negundo]
MRLLEGKDFIGIGADIKDSSGKVMVAICEVDALNVAAMLNYDKSFLGDAMFIISDIKSLCIEAKNYYRGIFDPSCIFPGL